MSEVKTDKISSVSTNGDITLDPDGTGNLIVSSGTLGVSVTPEAFNTVDGAAQVGTRQTLTSFSNDAGIGYNHYYNSGWKYTNADVARRFSSTSTIPFIWQYTASGSADAAITWSEAMRIDSSGNLLVGTTSTTAAQSNVSGGLSYRPTAQLEVNGNTTQAAFFGRTDDGEIIRFFSAGANEGAITVSGTTVSYVGGHLSRWSQLADNTKDTSIVRGTVMTNLDQMAEWTKDGVTEENEQLNCMAVSSVEGDANVAGVFVNWDDDDEDYTADMNVAMTGDFIIRIAQGTTVARGDLLMSAGDGTAKPQGDDIVRSKTIAKVTSTNVSHTYDDGSYLVPCVLMAC